MVTKAPEVTDRKARADTQRNRERILEVDKQEFTRSEANTSLEEIARQARVGPEHERSALHVAVVLASLLRPCRI